MLNKNGRNYLIEGMLKIYLSNISEFFTPERYTWYINLKIFGGRCYV